MHMHFLFSPNPMKLGLIGMLSASLHFVGMLSASLHYITIHDRRTSCYLPVKTLIQNNLQVHINSFKSVQQFGNALWFTTASSVDNIVQQGPCHCFDETALSNCFPCKLMQELWNHRSLLSQPNFKVQAIVSSFLAML